MRRVTLEPGAWAAIAEHAARGAPEEVCGLLIGAREAGTVQVTRATPCANLAEAAERHRRFLLDPRAVLDAQRTLRGSPESLLGFYHSHPNGEAEPSHLDRSYMTLWPATVWLIVPVDARAAPGQPRAWWLDEPNRNPEHAPAATEETRPRELDLRIEPTRGEPHGS